LFSGKNCADVFENEGPPVENPKLKTRVSVLAIVSASLVPLSCLTLILVEPYLSSVWNLVLIGLPITAIAGVALSVVASRKVRMSEGRLLGTFLAEFGIFLDVLVLFLASILYLADRSDRDYARRPTCVNNLKQLGLVLGLYATEKGEQYPPIDDVKNNFIFEADAVYPEYLTDTSILACPGDPETNPKENFRLCDKKHHFDGNVGTVHPDCITDMSYCYLGWLVTTDEEAEAFFRAYDNLAPEDYDRDIIVPERKGNGGGNVIHRIREGAERFMRDPSITAHEIPIMWDKPSANPANLSHLPAGGNVLYLDGHVEFIAYPGKFPMTEMMARLLDERPRDPIPDCEESEIDTQ
jgi:prepilin-type processing-associated H-X9-DG protein